MNLAPGLSTLDPAYARDQGAIWMCGQIYNRLVEFDKDLNIQPSLATSWTISDSGKTYTFALRTDVKFHKDRFFLMNNDVKTDMYLIGAMVFAVWRLVAYMQDGKWYQLVLGFTEGSFG